MSSSEECPAAVADDATIVKGVLLVGLGNLLADVTDDQVEVGPGIRRRGYRFRRCVVTPGIVVIVVAVVVVVVRGARLRPSWSVRHHNCHQVFGTIF
jgi:hypothetical protein